jgi:hypothetical protein
MRAPSASGSLTTTPNGTFSSRRRLGFKLLQEFLVAGPTRRVLLMRLVGEVGRRAGIWLFSAHVVPGALWSFNEHMLGDCPSPSDAPVAAAAFDAVGESHLLHQIEMASLKVVWPPFLLATSRWRAPWAQVGSGRCPAE